MDTHIRADDLIEARPDDAADLHADETATRFDAHPEVKREAAHGSPLDASRIDAIRIVRASDGGQLRTVMTGTKLVRTVAYPSFRYRCVRYGEATTEAVRLPAEELCPTTVDAIAQPMRIEARVDGRWLRTVVDVAALRTNAEAVLVECKRDWALFRTRQGVTQSTLARLGARCLGWGYERYVLAAAGSELRRANVDEVQACRFVHVPDAGVARVSSLLAAGSASLASVAAALAPTWFDGRARAFALMARRILEIDLDAPLGAATECRATPAPSDFMPTLRPA